MGFSGWVKTLFICTCVIVVLCEDSVVNPYLSKSDVTDWTVNFVRKYGYEIQTHEISTTDGYILTLHRIPSTTGKRGKPVLLHHGFLGTSSDFVVLGPQDSLGFILADEGFDVWIANARGTTNSRRHQFRNSSTDSRYWDFSWHEVGDRDLPAEIDYILAETAQQKLSYVGFSMGTTAFFVLASSRPEYNHKVNKMIALGPVAFMEHVRGPVMKYVSSLLSNVPFINRVLGGAEFLPENRFVSWAAQKFCENNRLSQYLCSNVLFLIHGFNNDVALSGELVDRIFEYSPAGGSVKEFLHFGQTVNSGQFRHYDLGFLYNYARYGQRHPPDYPLHKITVPVHLFMGKNDWFAVPEDVQTLSMHLPNTPTLKLLERETANHFDFLYASDVRDLCYNDVVRIIKDD